MMTQFQLEQAIMTCWNVTEDLEILNQGVLERDMTKDEISNVLVGMKQLYQLKFEKCFELYELLLKEKHYSSSGQDTGFSSL